MNKLAKISEKTNEMVEELRTLTGKSKIELLENAMCFYRHNERMRMFNENYETLKSNSESWKEEIEERNKIMNMDSSDFS